MLLPKIEQSLYSATLSNGESVTYRPYTVKEEKSILISKETGTEQDMILTSKQLVSACTFGKLDVEKLLTFDFEKLFLHIRAKSAGEMSDLLISCSECKTNNQVSINVEDCKLEGTVKSEKERTVSITDKIGVVMNYPSMGGLSNIETQSTDDMIGTVVKCIELIYDENNIYKASDSKFSELLEFVDSLNSKQFVDICNVITEMPKLVIDAEFDCSKCKHHNELKLEGITNFF